MKQAAASEREKKSCHSFYSHKKVEEKRMNEWVSEKEREKL